MERLKVELGERSYPIEIVAGLLQHPEVLAQTIKGKRVMIVTNTVVAPCISEQIIQLLSGFPGGTPDPAGWGGPQDLWPPSSGSCPLCWKPAMAVTPPSSPWGRRDRATLLASLRQAINEAFRSSRCLPRCSPRLILPSAARPPSTIPFGKNMVGAFYQPRHVIIDTDCLKTFARTGVCRRHG